MALNFSSPVRRTGLALVAGLLLFAVLAAATVDSGNKIPVGDLSVAEIEDKLQVNALKLLVISGRWQSVNRD